MQSNLSGLNYRHLRRSACDRCRTYKLRCERGSRTGTSCDRCLKIQLACTTTFNHSSQRLSSTTAQDQTTTEGRDKSNSNTTKQSRPRELRLATTRRLPSPPKEQDTATSNSSSSGSNVPCQGNAPSPPLPRQAQQAAGEDPTRVPLSRRQTDLAPTRTVDAMEQHPMDASEDMLDQDCLALEEMDFTISGISFDTMDLALPVADGSAHSETEPRRGDGVDNSGIFGENDETTMDVNLIAWQSSHIAFPGTSIEGGKDPETDSENQARSLSSSYKDLLKLSLELVEDQELLDTLAPLGPKHSPVPVCSHSHQHYPINRILNHTTHFWEILKRISASTETPAHHRVGSSYENTVTGSSSSNSNHSNINEHHRNSRQDWTCAGATDRSYEDWDSSSSQSSVASPPHRQDHLLIVNLVTTYVYLVRSCQGVFTRLYNALEVTPAADSSSILNLPSLQLGEFQLNNNLTIQVKVLIELISSMLLRIEETLGISAVNAVGKRSSRTENYRLSILNNPLAVSIREIILSQERMQGGIRNGELAFSDIMRNIKQLLEH